KLSPVGFRRDFDPLVLQAGLETIVPGGEFLSVLLARPVTEPIGAFDVLVSRYATRRDGFFPGCLRQRVVNVLVCVRLGASEIVFRLIPIPLERGLYPLPCRIIRGVPPFWIRVFRHFVPPV